MTCRIVRSLLPLHAGGDLPAFVGARVAAHAARCAACEAELRSLRAARGLVRSSARRAESAGAGAAEARLGDDFWHAIRRDLRSNGLVGEPARRARPPLWLGLERGLALRALAAAAAVLAAALLFAPRTANDDGGPEVARVTRAGAPERAPVDDEGEGGVGGETSLSPPVVGPVAGWIEETETFAPDDVRFGIEQWRPVGTISGEREIGEVADF